MAGPSFGELDMAPLNQIGILSWPDPGTCMKHQQQQWSGSVTFLYGSASADPFIDFQDANKFFAYYVGTNYRTEGTFT